LEFNVPFQHKYGYIRDDWVMGQYLRTRLRKETRAFKTTDARTKTKSCRPFGSFQNVQRTVTSIV